MSSNQNAPQTLSVLSIHAHKCLKCSHLVAWASTEYSCTSDTNPHCPAQCVKIVVGFNMDVVAKRISAAMLAGDAAKVSQQMTRLSQHDTHIQQQVMAKVAALSSGVPEA